jgi:glycosyltransferase involved in cell wall biosynthesis
MHGINFWKIHIKTNFLDFVQKRCMAGLAIAFLLMSFLHPQKAIRLKMMMKSHRSKPLHLSTYFIKKNLGFIQKNASRLFDGRDSANISIQKSRAIVLKNPIIDTTGNCIEKGIYLIKFTGTFQYYIERVDIDALRKLYYIVLEPSWAGYCLSEILWWTKFDDPIFVEASEKSDYEFILNLSTNLVPLTIGSSDWVNHDSFFPIPETEEKIYDFIYVSNHSRIKRNFLLLQALAKIKNHNFKAALVCSGWGDERDYTYALRTKLGLTDKVDIIEKLSQKDLNILLNKSKVNLLLSLKEGSNRSIFESMFANTPCLVLQSNIGVNKTYINAHTGLLIPEKDLPQTLLWYRYHWQEFSPRKWAMENISIFKTKEKLDNIIASHALARGGVFSVGSALKINASEATYYDDSEAREMHDTNRVREQFEKAAHRQ